MSVVIDIKNVSAVLLQDGWHTVKVGSFSVDEVYRYTGLGKGKDQRINGLVATWEDNIIIVERIACPIASVLAVKYKDSN